MTKVELSNGFAMMKDFVDRKTMRLYRKALFQNSKTAVSLDGQGLEKEKLSLDPSSMDEANDVLVRNMVTEAQIGDKNIALEDDFFDGMSQEDFDTMLSYCTKLINKKEVEKKS